MVNTWKIILVIAVIFAAGLFTGRALSRQWSAQPASRPAATSAEDAPFMPREVRDDYIRRLTRELKLTPEQRSRISEDISESQHRIKIMFELIGPEMREEMQQVRESIQAALTPEQRAHYDEFRKGRPKNAADRKANSAKP